jgi:hypothetical protein
MLPGPELRDFLLRYPTVSYRMLGAMAQRLRTANSAAHGE